ncbi:uncharacterized protein A4U43_C03F1350 [Asparagus officinalis]|uniref:Uncharacterized protein n=1 Tax=Asparagus officinalis TaxID=4686 RepID=A0A5P1FAX7_ASPOF|nr:uncharacterized protein A4U43_C03F1350 [Asparagus officinalis]
MEIFKSFGWSESMFFAAIKTVPSIVLLSEPNIRERMEFFVDMAGYSPSYFALHPILLTYGVEKWLLPRYQVWKVLKTNKLVGGNRSICSFMQLRKRKFFERFILRYEDLVPNRHQT